MGKCCVCGQGVNGLSGNPSEWPIELPYPGDCGRTRMHCTACVGRRLKAIDGIPDPARFVEAAKALRDAIRCNDNYESTPRCDGRTATKLIYGRCDACDAMHKFDQALAAKESQ